MNEMDSQKFAGKLHEAAYNLLNTPRKLAELQSIAEQATGQERACIGGVIEAYIVKHGPDNMNEENPGWEQYKREHGISV